MPSSPFPDMEFKAKYLGGHLKFPKKHDTTIRIYSDRIQLDHFALDIPFETIKKIGNVELTKDVKYRHIIAYGGSAVGALKKKNLATAIVISDNYGQEMTLLFEFGSKIDAAQGLIYERVMQSRLRAIETQITEKKKAEQERSPDDDKPVLPKLKGAVEDLSTLKSKAAQAYRTGDLVGAALCYERITALHPEDYVMWGNKGWVMHKMARHQDAMDCFEMAISINPRDSVIWSNKGQVLTELKRYKDALQAYEMALSLNPENVSAKTNRGRVLDVLRKQPK